MSLMAIQLIVTIYILFMFCRTTVRKRSLLKTGLALFCGHDGYRRDRRDTDGTMTRVLLKQLSKKRDKKVPRPNLSAESMTNNLAHFTESKTLWRFNTTDPERLRRHLLKTGTIRSTFVKLDWNGCDQTAQPSTLFPSIYSVGIAYIRARFIVT